MMHSQPKNSLLDDTPYRVVNQAVWLPLDLLKILYAFHQLKNVENVLTFDEVKTDYTGWPKNAHFHSRE